MRPGLEIADIFRSAGLAYRTVHAGHLSLQELKVMTAIEHCRTLALGGAVAASLPAVDLGLAPVSRQVGQSGKFVTPEIYLAAGMSGTPQHLAGIGTATRIIAINSDRDALIFGVAEAGAVANALALLPLLGAAIDTLV